MRWSGKNGAVEQESTLFIHKVTGKWKNSGTSGFHLQPMWKTACKMQNKAVTRKASMKGNYQSVPQKATMPTLYFTEDTMGRAVSEQHDAEGQSGLERQNPKKGKQGF